MRLFELDARSREIADADVKLWNKISQDCSEALKASSNGEWLYKGLTDLGKPVYFTDPKLQVRRSKHNLNHYTLLFDNLPSWQAYPKRSQSLICSSSAFSACDYGARYLVLPLNGAKVAIAPTFDIWSSFLDQKIGTLKSFTIVLDHLGISDSNYQDMLQGILQNRTKFAQQVSAYSWTPEFLKIAECKTTLQVELILDNIFNPTRNKFTCGSVRALSAGDREAWTDSASYLICVDSRFYRDYISSINQDIPITNQDIPF